MSKRKRNFRSHVYYVELIVVQIDSGNGKETTIRTISLYFSLTYTYILPILLPLLRGFRSNQQTLPDSSVYGRGMQCKRGEKVHRVCGKNLIKHSIEIKNKPGWNFAETLK